MAGDQGGHLIAASLGGIGERINLVPQTGTLNQGAYKAMENEFRVALTQGKSVSVKIDLVYPSISSQRPGEFLVRATIDGERKEWGFKQ